MRILDKINANTKIITICEYGNGQNNTNLKLAARRNSDKLPS